jgi:hypothetical protein
VQILKFKRHHLILFDWLANLTIKLEIHRFFYMDLFVQFLVSDFIRIGPTVNSVKAKVRQRPIG